MSRNDSSSKRSMNTRKDEEISEPVIFYNRGDVRANNSCVSLPLHHHSFYSYVYEYHSFFAFTKENFETRSFSLSMTLEILVTRGLLLLSTE